jgi:protein-S-isoprenylcysteine O-methyltransferase Ste14
MQSTKNGGKPMKILRGFGFMIATLLLYLGVPLLGWGLGNLPGYFSSSQRTAYAVVVTLFGLAVGYQAIDTPEGIRGGKGQPGKLVSRQSAVRFAVIIFLYVALFFLPFADRRSIGVMPGVPAWQWVGLILTALGFGLVFWSGFALGRQYSPEVTIQEDHKLITGSIYRYIRHPRYLGVLLLAPGMSLLFRSWIGLVFSLFLTGLLLFRIRDEETLMHIEFGQEWDVYCQRSWRLIPFLF